MHQEMEMRWFINRIARRRFANQAMACTREAIPEAMRQVREKTPPKEDIDPDEVARTAYQIGLSVAVLFTDEGLLTDPDQRPSGANGQ